MATKKKSSGHRYECYEIKQFVCGATRAYEVWGKYLYDFEHDGWKFWRVRPRYSNHKLGAFATFDRAEQFISEHTGGYYENRIYCYGKDGSPSSYVMVHQRAGGVVPDHQPPHGEGL